MSQLEYHYHRLKSSFRIKLCKLHAYQAPINALLLRSCSRNDVSFIFFYFGNLISQGNVLCCQALGSVRLGCCTGLPLPYYGLVHLSLTKMTACSDGWAWLGRVKFKYCVIASVSDEDARSNEFPLVFSYGG